MTRKGYEAYKLYLAMQRHFSTNYDFFKYNGKVNVSVDAYQKRNDKFSFEKLTNIVLEEDLKDFYLAHFIENPKCWIREMSKTNFEKYKAHIKNFPTTFRNDLQSLVMQHNLPDLLKVGNDIPGIHKLALNGSITIETIIAMDHYYSFLDKHKEKVQVSFLWPDYIDKLINYRPFFTANLTDFHKDIMKDVLLG